MPNVVIISSKSCLDYEARGHPESPHRIRASRALLESRGYRFVEAETASEEDILRVHSRHLFELVRRGGFEEPDTPDLPGMFEHARRSAGAAIQASDLARGGQPAFSLMRPPGHHATRERLMGFCYFNNIAIAVMRQVAKHASRVAIVDFDCHHGNGTEEIVRGQPNVLFVSLHQSPCYPYTGLRSEANCLNFPLPAGTGEAEYLATLDQALERVRQFRPQLVAVSAGFDAYEEDPITHMALQVGTFRHIGARLGSLKLPLFSVLEGGYSSALARCIVAYLEGLES